MAITAATIDGDRWCETLNLVSRCTNSLGALLLPLRGEVPIITPMDSIGRSVEEYMKGGWYQRDARYRGSAIAVSTGAVTDREFITDDEVERHPYYQEFIRKCGLAGWAGVRVGSGEMIWTLALQRSIKQDLYSNEEMTALRKLASDLKNIPTIASTLALARAKSALDAFEFAARACLLIDRSANVVLANSRAEALFDADFDVKRGRLLSSSREAISKFEEAVRETHWNIAGKTTEPIRFPRHGRYPLFVYVVRLAGLTSSPLSSFYGLVIVVDPGFRPTISIETLRLSYGLTLAEARLCSLLTAGLDVNGAAQRLEISVETARAQLKSIFSKVGVHKQTDLIAQLANHLPDR